ncbi:unnamed protein product [Microthlaspi erraticum]|uniref:Uncharacterized protein n=1 Tax=Microthlaspi erraticum TaxID=1685480 RepID=A0A6D2K0G2_9BRAS|nr:unnamed protein product [Microthlaspi erraticum]
MAHLGSPLDHLHQPIGSPLLLPLHSQSHHSFFIWRTISLLLNKVHSNLKLPLLTLTTNRVIPLLGSPFSLNLSLSDFLRVDISLCIRFFHPLIHPLQIGLHLKPSFPCIA